MVAQTGYNFLYGLWKYSWDADCELFLKILEEEIKEDVYTQQIQLQASPPALNIGTCHFSCAAAAAQAGTVPPFAAA